MQEIITDAIRVAADGKLLAERNEMLAGDLFAFHLGDAYYLIDLSTCALVLPNLRALDSSQLREFLIPLLQPGFGLSTRVPGLRLGVDDLATRLYSDLRGDAQLPFTLFRSDIEPISVLQNPSVLDR